MDSSTRSIVSLRFSEIVRRLKNSGKIDSYARFAKSLDYSPQSLNEIMKGRRDVTIEVIRKLFITYNIPPSDIFDIPGQEKKTPATRKREPKHSSSFRFQPVRLIESQQTLDWIQHHDQPEFYRDLPVIHLPWEEEESQGLIAYNYMEDLMYPELCPNDWLIAEPKKELSELKNGQLYIILSAYGFLIRRLSHTSESLQRLTVQTNTQYNLQQHIKMKDIHALYQVKARFTQLMPEPVLERS